MRSNYGMVNGMADDYVHLMRNTATCDGCLRCNHIIHGFANMTCIKIRREDLRKEEVLNSVQVMIDVCDSDSISIE